MNASERYLSVFDENKRKKLDRVPLHVQYIREEFIEKNRAQIMKNYKGRLIKNDYFDFPMILGFDAIFAPFPNSYTIKSIKIGKNQNQELKIKEDGQLFHQKTAYYEGGYIHTLEILSELEANLKRVDVSKQIQKIIQYYQRISPYIFPIPMVDGIFDRTWKAMGMVEFSRHFKKRTKLYNNLIGFYSNLTRINIEGLISATRSQSKVITLLDDVAYKGRVMISPERWKSDFLPLYKEVNSMIKDAGLIAQLHTDGEVTELIPSFIEAGFSGLQGFEGGCDPNYINQEFPEFVVIGFGDVSYILPYGSAQEVENHVKSLMDSLKQNRHFIIGPSTVIFKEIPLENVNKFVTTAKLLGTY